MAYITIDRAAHQTRDQRRARAYTVLVHDAYEIKDQLKAAGFSFLPGLSAWAQVAMTWADAMQLVRTANAPMLRIAGADMPYTEWVGGLIYQLREQPVSAENAQSLVGVTAVDENGNIATVTQEMAEWLVGQSSMFA